MTIQEPTEEAIAAAAAILCTGGLVGMPTETVYGLAADAGNGRAVAAIFAAKARPQFNPLIVHVTDAEAASRLGEITGAAERLASAFWPGPLTLVVRKRLPSPVAELTTAGLDTVAVRVPSHPVARALLRAVERPIAAPSANRSGHVSPTTAAHVAADLGSSVALVLDGGAAPIGLESTVLDVTGAHPVVLRLGAITRGDIERVIGHPVAVADGEPDKPRSPGMMARHYAPAARLRIDALDVHEGEALLGFGPAMPKHAGEAINLSPPGDLAEAAANLFSALRTLDATGTKSIAVMPIPHLGLGEAINDRLQRAARTE